MMEIDDTNVIAALNDIEVYLNIVDANERQRFDYDANVKMLRLLWMALSEPEVAYEVDVIVMEVMLRLTKMDAELIATWRIQIDNDPGKELNFTVISRVVRRES